MRLPPITLFIPVKTPFTLNASAYLSSLWNICRVAMQPTGLWYRAICERAPKARYHKPATSCLQISICFGLLSAREGVSSLNKVLRYAPQSIFYRICFWSTGGSRETPAYYFVYLCKNYDALVGYTESSTSISISP